MFEAMNRAIELHKIVPVIDRVFGFEQAKDVYRHLESQKHVGKVAIRVGHEAGARLRIAPHRSIPPHAAIQRQDFTTKARRHEGTTARR